MEQDSPATQLYLLTKGTAELSIARAGGTDLFRSTYGPGEAIGEAARGDAPGYFGTVTALKDIEGIVVDVSRFHDLRREFDPAAYRLLRQLCIGLCLTVRHLNEEITSGTGSENDAGTPRGPDGSASPPSGDSMSVLRGMPFFEGFTQAEMDVLKDVLKQWTVEENHLLFAEGEQGDSCFIAVRGTVDVSVDRDGRRHSLATLGAGRIFGEISLLDRGPRGATCIVGKDAVLVEIHGDDFQKLFDSGSRLSLKLLEAVYFNLLAAQRASFAERAGQSIAAGHHARQWVLV